MPAQQQPPPPATTTMVLFLGVIAVATVLGLRDPGALRDLGPVVLATGAAHTAAEHGIALFELSHRSVSLEEAFMDLTRDSVEYQSTATAAQAPRRAA